jgi:hypothetical protein
MDDREFIRRLRASTRLLEAIQQAIAEDRILVELSTGEETCRRLRVTGAYTVEPILHIEVAELEDC